MIYKNRDIEAVINERGVNLGNIDVVFTLKILIRLLSDYS